VGKVDCGQGNFGKGWDVKGDASGKQGPNGCRDGRRRESLRMIWR